MRSGSKYKGGRKRGMKKRWVILLSNILSIILIAISLSGCKGWERYNAYIDPWEIKQQRNGFYYYLVDKDGKPEGKNHPPAAAIILGLVSEGKEREELVIPETLGGYPVKQIGESFTAFIGSPTRDYGIDATNIEKIVIIHECSITDETGLFNLKELEINADVELYVTVYIPQIEKIVFNINLSSLTDYKSWASMWDIDWIEKQVVKFDAVGGKQKTYAIALNQAEKLLEPEEPNKEGFTFSGWYVDEEYTTKWNFKTDVVTENITLYAKWIEV